MSLVCVCVCVCVSEWVCACVLAEGIASLSWARTCRVSVQRSQWACVFTSSLHLHRLPLDCPWMKHKWILLLMTGTADGSVLQDWCKVLIFRLLRTRRKREDSIWNKNTNMLNHTNSLTWLNRTSTGLFFVEYVWQANKLYVVYLVLHQALSFIIFHKQLEWHRVHTSASVQQSPHETTFIKSHKFVSDKSMKCWKTP